MLPNNACDLLLAYLLSSIKSPSFLAQNLSFCQIDIWDSVLLLNCPGQEVFEFILERKKAISIAIAKQLSEVKLLHIRCQKEVVDLIIADLLNEQEDSPQPKYHLAFDVANLVRQSIKPVLVAKLDGQILFAYLPQTHEDFSVRGIYLSSVEAARLAKAVEDHGWVDGYCLKLDSYDSGSVLTTVRARYAKDNLLNELILLIQVLNSKSLQVVQSRDIA